jgi:hypothetical protein
MADHTHTWKEDKTRTHGRPPRFYAICKECRVRTQAVMRYGFIHPFNTHKPTDPKLKSKVYSIRLIPAAVKSVNSGVAQIVVKDNCLRLQYKS